MPEHSGEAGPDSKWLRGPGLFSYPRGYGESQRLQEERNDCISALIRRRAERTVQGNQMERAWKPFRESRAVCLRVERVDCGGPAGTVRAEGAGRWGPPFLKSAFPWFTGKTINNLALMWELQLETADIFHCPWKRKLKVTQSVAIYVSKFKLYLPVGIHS